MLAPPTQSRVGRDDAMPGHFLTIKTLSTFVLDTRIVSCVRGTPADAARQKSMVRGS
jgi:hypothetical protein